MVENGGVTVKDEWEEVTDIVEWIRLQIFWCECEQEKWKDTLTIVEGKR
jgi:hypothetical protein